MDAFKKRLNLLKGVNRSQQMAGTWRAAYLPDWASHVSAILVSPASSYK